MQPAVSSASAHFLQRLRTDPEGVDLPNFGRAPSESSDDELEIPPWVLTRLVRASRAFWDLSVAGIAGENSDMEVENEPPNQTQQRQQQRQPQSQPASGTVGDRSPQQQTVRVVLGWQRTQPRKRKSSKRLSLRLRL
ncbi:uncharacterized protein LOC126284946 [Schistocerca gregaria]|uniref:uncharacterized protein LOC126284946 n=1 Tax=Schistocerca gregaria TaxID=7010 RepID=UPI00211E20CF|nr:uncharacterized protein LOC126284946 [Schistocerca gregaria]